MFSELTTMKIINGVFNLTVETYDEMVKLCKKNINIIGMKNVIQFVIYDTISDYKPLLIPMYVRFYFDVTGDGLQINTPPLLIPIEIYENDDLDTFKEHVKHENITNSQLLKESIQCNAERITKYLISNKCVFDPIYIHYCWTKEMFNTIKDHFHVDINEKDEANYMMNNQYKRYFYRNKFVEHVLKSKNENFSYDDYLQLDCNNMYLERLLHSSMVMGNYEFVGAVCNRSEIYLYYIFNYILRFNNYIVLLFIQDAYKKFFEFVVTYNKYNEIYVFCPDEDEDMSEFYNTIATVYSQDVTDEYGRDLCMLLLDPDDITESKINNVITLLQLKEIDLQKRDINGKTLMEYIDEFSKLNNRYAKELITFAHAIHNKL